jgi:hypothetical protein
VLCGTQNHILISSSETADGVSTPDSVIMPEIKSGGCISVSEGSKGMATEAYREVDSIVSTELSLHVHVGDGFVKWVLLLRVFVQMIVGLEVKHLLLNRQVKLAKRIQPNKFVALSHYIERLSLALSEQAHLIGTHT